jgi:hypothetical protein
VYSQQMADNEEKQMKRIYLAAAAGLLALLSMSPVALRATALDTPFTFTTNEAVAIENTVLLPGTYTVKSVDGGGAVVMIFNKDGERRIATSLFINVDRPAGSAETSAFTLYETAPGTVPALRDIFPAGENLGIEFPAPR